MKTKLCILLCSIFMFGACTSDYEPPVPKNNSKQATRSGEPEVTMNEDSILRFRDIDTFNEVVSALDCMETEEKRFEFMRKLVPGFVSMKENYLRTLEEVDSVVETEEDLEQLKQRHPEFFYANEGEDAGIYLPMEEPMLAYLLTSSGYLKIAKQQDNTLKKATYESLKAQGLTYSASDSTIDLADFNAQSTRPNYNNGSNGTFTFQGSRVKEVPKGVKYSSGWIKKGKRKFKIEARRDIEKTNVPGGSYFWTGRLHVELSFRKKVAGRWINYRSRTESLIKLKNIDEREFHIAPQQNRNGRSDHDIFIPIPCNIWTDGVNYCYTYPTLVCNASIKYQGFSDNMDFSWQLGGAYCNTTWKYDILYRWLY